MLQFSSILLFALSAANVFAAEQDPASFFPTDLSLVHPASKIAIGQAFDLGYFVNYGHEEATLGSGLQANVTMGLIIPTNSTESNPLKHDSSYSCGSSDGITTKDIKVSFPGVYTVFWNVTSFLASDPSKDAPATDGHSGTCGAGPYMSLGQNFSATFEISELPLGPEAASMTTVTSQLPAPTGTIIRPSSLSTAMSTTLSQSAPSSSPTHTSGAPSILGTGNGLLAIVGVGSSMLMMTAASSL